MLSWFFSWRNWVEVYHRINHMFCLVPKTFYKPMKSISQIFSFKLINSWLLRNLSFKMCAVCKIEKREITLFKIVITRIYELELFEMFVFYAKYNVFCVAFTSANKIPKWQIYIKFVKTYNFSYPIKIHICWN